MLSRWNLDAHATVIRTEQPEPPSPETTTLHRDERRQTVSLTPVSLGVNFHLLPENPRTDLYAGPFLSYALGDDLVNNRFGLGAVLGLERAIGRGWLFAAALRFTRIELEWTAAEPTADLDPLALQIGVGYSF